MKLDMDKKTLICVGVIIVAGLAFFLFIRPLWTKSARLSKEVKALNTQLQGMRTMLDESRQLNRNRHLLTRAEVSAAMNEILEAGRSLDIDVYETNPQPIQKPAQSDYPVLPIQMELQSTYKDFGVFLGMLEDLNGSIVTVREFHINRDPVILPDIRVTVVLEIHLREGEGG